jgi:dTDP-glucose 4,6-dehydratase
MLVTGGCGFIGSNFILSRLAQGCSTIVNLDCLTYAGNPQNLAPVAGDPRLRFFQGDICDASLVERLLHQFRPRTIVHFAAETHVDRSCKMPGPFIQTNVVGTFQLLQSAHAYWRDLPGEERAGFRFVHISTDEVYGSLGSHDQPFRESSPYQPNSLYSAAKAASDHLVRAYHQTHGLPVLTLHSSNIYGPRQFPEKLVPLAILNCLSGAPLPVYGDGKHRRDWLYVEDYCRAVSAIIERGRIGHKYNVGSGTEWTTLEVVTAVRDLVNTLRPDQARSGSEIVFVEDRAGHDRRYLMDCGKVRQELGWSPAYAFPEGLRKTVEWYFHNPAWVQAATGAGYKAWIETQYAFASVQG